jgi:hypothetical protein
MLRPWEQAVKFSEEFLAAPDGVPYDSPPMGRTTRYHCSSNRGGIRWPDVRRAAMDLPRGVRI